MAQFRIESYELKAASHNQERTIQLFGPILSHGLRNRVSIYFKSLPLSFATEGVIGYAYDAAGLGHSGMSFGVWFKEHMFAQVHSILQSEDPIDFHYQLKNIAASPASVSKHVVSAYVAIGAEPSGKGLRYAESTIIRSEAPAPEAYAERIPAQGQGPVPLNQHAAQRTSQHSTQRWHGWLATSYRREARAPL